MTEKPRPAAWWQRLRPRREDSRFIRMAARTAAVLAIAAGLTGYVPDGFAIVALLLVVAHQLIPARPPST